jgi:hypothetical protein
MVMMLRCQRRISARCTHARSTRQHRRRHNLSMVHLFVLVNGGQG